MLGGIGLPTRGMGGEDVLLVVGLGSLVGRLVASTSSLTFRVVKVAIPATTSSKTSPTTLVGVLITSWSHLGGLWIVSVLGVGSWAIRCLLGLDRGT